MPPITIDVYSEGKTEKEVLAKLCRRGICPYTLEERGGDGDPEFIRKLQLQLRRWFELPQAPPQPLHLLVLRD